MSIKIIIPRSGGEESVPEGVEEALENPSINVPKHSQAKSNDLSKLENSICSSKYTLSGDDMNSNLSIDSNFFVNGKIFNNYNSNADLEKEIDIEISQEKISTPQKNQSYSKNFYVNNETNNNFSSERVICEELNNAHDKMYRNKKYYNFNIVLTFPICRILSMTSQLKKMMSLQDKVIFINPSDQKRR